MKKDTTPLFKIDWSKPYQAIVKITPEDAKRILENHNNGNRLLRSGGAKYIAEQIIRDEWIENHPQPICFSRNWRLIDGQHRINGIVLSGKSVWASCHFGVDPEYIKYLDTGISRSLGDRVAFVDHPPHNTFIASMLAMRHQMTKKGKITPDAAMEMFHEKKHSYIAIAELHNARKFVAKAIIGLAFVDYHDKYGREALEMYSELFKATTDCQPAQALKSFLFTTPLSGAKLYNYAVSACLANHEGRLCKQIKAASWR